MSTSATAAQPEMGAIRAALLPVHNDELKKFLPMCIIMFCILFNYTAMRDTKDIFFLNAPHSDSPVLGYLKSLCVLPSAFLFTFIYTKLVNVFSRDTLFVGFIVFFMSYFLLFGLVLYPNVDALHFSAEWVAAKQAANPSLKWFFPIPGYWTYSIYYVLSELWGSVMLSLLFWQFANDIVRTNEAKRFYALFSLVANFSLIFAGGVTKQVAKSSMNGGNFDDQFINIIMAMGISAAVIVVVYRWVCTKVLTDPKYYDEAEAQAQKGKKKKKPKLSIGESFKYILTSRYIGFIAMMVLAYGVTINLIEVVWKHELKLAFPSKAEMAAFRGAFSQMTGIATIVLIMFTKGVVKRFGWTVGALITPTVLTITGGVFFGFVLFEDLMNPLVMATGFTATLLAAYVGAAQNFLTKGVKYAHFDPTKEMAYIPLDAELKTKGKAAVDVIGGRLGKASGGAVTMLFFSILMPGASVVQVAPWFGLIVLVFVVIWYVAVFGLSKDYKVALDKHEAEKAA